MFLMACHNPKQNSRVINPKKMEQNNVQYKKANVDGLEIFYREAGPKDAPTILLLHGFPTSSFMYRNLIDELKDRYHLIAPDYPGFGYSSFPKVNEYAYTFDNLSLTMEKFIDAIGLKKFSLYVQDYGSPVGLRIVSRRPELLECLIVQNANAYSSGIGPLFDPIIAVWTDQSPAKKQKVMDLFELPVTKFQYTDGVSDTLSISPDTYYLDQHFMDRDGNKEAQFQLQYDYRNNPPQYPTWHKMFREKQPPTIIVWGVNDQFFKKEGALAYGEDLKNIEFHFYPTGHFALEEFHEDIARKIDAFLSKNIRL
jgi:pimeloyl-ACP methyl ester carboxylesterase